MRARFSKPTMPGDALTVSVWDIGAEAEGFYRFRTETQPGETVIDSGLFQFGLSRPRGAAGQRSPSSRSITSTRWRSRSTSAASERPCSIWRRSREERRARSSTASRGTSRWGPCAPSTMREGMCPARYHERRVDRATPAAAEASSRVSQPSSAGWSGSCSSSSSQSTPLAVSLAAALLACHGGRLYYLTPS